MFCISGRLWEVVTYVQELVSCGASTILSNNSNVIGEGGQTLGILILSYTKCRFHVC